MKLSIVIPVYNEEATVEELVDRVFSVDLGTLEREVIISDDGSTDGSSAIIRRLAARRPEIRLHMAQMNMGKGAAVRFGMQLATGDIVMVQDADLELDPGDIPSLVAPIVRGEAQVVYGSRFLKPTHKVPLRGKLANGFLVCLTNLLYGSRLTDMATGYKVFRRETLNRIRLRSVGFEFEPEVTAKLLRAGFKIAEIPITYAPRTEADGKKIGFPDGMEYIYTLLKYRLWVPERQMFNREGQT